MLQHHRVGREHIFLHINSTGVDQLNRNLHLQVNLLFRWPELELQQLRV